VSDTPVSANGFAAVGRRIEAKECSPMPEQWLSVAEAAASMKVHPRTIERPDGSR